MLRQDGVSGAVGLLANQGGDIWGQWGTEMVHMPLSLSTGLGSAGPGATLGLEPWGGGFPIPSPCPPCSLCACSDGRAGVPRGAAADERHAGDADEEDGHPGQAREQH